ncbi:DUF2961 domain-containing protein [Acidobacteria bacterium AH-259-G07]|nr:DUF2961 domain-containing protein [Acidobacteria bacterium AH-259-G07]
MNGNPVFTITALLVLFVSVTFAGPQELDQPRTYTVARSSSYRVDGGNADRVEVPPKGSYTAAELSGAGRIVHMWFTIATDEPNYLRTTKIKIYWDRKREPAVDVPFGDFHVLGHGLIRQVQSALITVVARPHLNHNLANKNVGGFNSYFPMPFGSGARVVIENTSNRPIRALYYHINYQKWEAAPSPLRFHARYHETPAEPYPGAAAGRREAKNPSGHDNHLILDVKGRGHFLGVVLSVDALGAGWWEGDEMIWVDGENRPSIHGTGTEDYFGGAWGFRQEYNRPYHGISVLQRVASREDWRAGKFTVYRFHLNDPISFTRSLKISIERGHNNHRRDCTYSSVAYWYQG